MPPVFFDALLPGDLPVLKRQSGSRFFDPTIVAAVSRRCRHGFPQVTACCPLRDGRPFPTIFWLTCPFLSRAIDTLESSGGVREMGEVISCGKEEEWLLFNRVHSLARVFLLGPEMAKRLMEEDPPAWDALVSTGAGGIRPKKDVSVKCLHLQAASMIGLGWHPAGDWLMERLGEMECRDPGGWPCGQA